MWVQVPSDAPENIKLHITGDKHMINPDRAKRVGINACIEKLGREFVEAHRDAVIYAYGMNQDVMYCFVGVDDKPQKGTEKLMLDSVSKWPYRVSCNVDLETEAITFIECVVKE